MQPGEEVTLNEEESRHAIQVLRVRIGDAIRILNGAGEKAYASVTSIQPKSIHCRIESAEHAPAPASQVHLYVALLKKRDKTEWIVEKAVELGAASITFFSAKHSEKSRIDIIRLEKIVISALKQSGNMFMPAVKWLPDFSACLNEAPGEKYIAYCPTGKERSLHTIKPNNKAASIFIGPEGDFSPEEVDLARKANALEVSLGDNILRAETAALYALITMKNAREQAT